MSIHDRVLDFGLDVLASESTHVGLFASEPIDTSSALGFKTFPPGLGFGPVVVVPGGRAVASLPISDGTIVTSGTVQWWAAYAPGTLHASGLFSASRRVVAGNSYGPPRPQGSPWHTVRPGAT